MATDSCWTRGYAAMLSAAEAVPFPCPSPFGPADRYELIELAAITTKSWIYRAADQSFLSDGKAPTVAIKISRTQDYPVEGFLGRKVEHPGVVRVLDHGRTDEGFGYLVMDWIDGGDLGAAKAPRPARDAAGLVARLAHIVQAAHNALVIHCDLKPSNVLLTSEGEPRLADFDLAQRASDTDCQRKGTLAYMAPEQYRGETGGHGVQADVYALGGILHFLTTGRAPHGEDPAKIKEALNRGDIPPAAGVEIGLARVIRRALSPDLAVRYTTAHELAVDLERWLDHKPLEWQTPGLPRRVLLWSRRRPAAAVALSAALILAVVGAAARMEWVRREHLREAEVAARSEIKAQEKYDTTSAAVQRVLIQAGRMLTNEKRNQMNNEELLASLSVMQWLDIQPPGRSDKQSGALHQYGMDVWTEVLARCERSGGAPDSLALYARINLARLAVDSGEFALAAKHVAQAEAHWGDRLVDGDTSKVALKVLRAIIAADEATIARSTEGLPGVSFAALEAEAKRVGIGESLLRHLRAAAAKCARLSASR